jgi:hypothetical protein
MNNNGWITDRVPTQDDTFDDWIFTMRDGEVVLNNLPWDVKEGEPWQPIPVPEPYVKPKRWSVEIAEVLDCRDRSKPCANAPDAYVVSDVTYSHWLPIGFTREAAERICDIYNEVLP